MLLIKNFDLELAGNRLHLVQFRLLKKQHFHYYNKNNVGLMDMDSSLAVTTPYIFCP